MEELVGVYLSKRRRIPVAYEATVIFTSGRRWPKSIRGKFIVRKATAIGLLHIDDADGEWDVDVSAPADEINPMIEKGEIEQLPITPENEAKIYPKKRAKKKAGGKGKKPARKKPKGT